MRLGLIVLASTVVSASARAQNSSSQCTGTEPDSTLTAALPLYRDCDVDKPARPKGRPPRLSLTSRHAGDGCIAAEFDIIVDTLGIPEPVILRADKENDSEMADAVRASLASLRFEPAKLGGRPVRQVVVYRQTAFVGKVLVKLQQIGSMPRGAPPTGRPPLVPACP